MRIGALLNFVKEVSSAGVLTINFLKEVGPTDALTIDFVFFFTFLSIFYYRFQFFLNVNPTRVFDERLQWN
jgi:hypothetical protein